MIIIDEFLVQIENAIKTKKELIAKLNNRIESLYDRSGAICLTIRNNNKYYYVKRKTKDKLFSKYIGKNLTEEERQKLINQIILYKKYRDLVPKLNNFYDQRGKMFSKKQDDVEKVLNKQIEKEVFVIPHQISFNALQKAMQAAYDKWRLNLFNNRKIIVQEVSAEQVEKEIQEIFEKYPDVTKYSLTDFFQLVDEKYLTDQYLVTCFVCLLDLAKNGQIVLSQEGFDNEIFFKVIRG